MLGMIDSPFRRAVQVLDLMSLHFQIHEFCKPNLILALLSVQFLLKIGLLYMDRFTGPGHLQTEITLWASSQRDGPDQSFSLFKTFLDLYCGDLLPENFETDNWAQELCSEMCFVAQFFILPTQYYEPCMR